ncbi:copper resistance D family protein [Dongia deserti]|uniref:copper resistance D family protein n=1 Tax=Dongia deserti TaxID=2268030 RepID=UPI000E647A18|nr:CopD family protein [Dongia deserti]
MDLLLDIFGFASVLLSGLVRTAQCLTLGGIAFLAFIAVPLGHGASDSVRLAPRTIQLTRVFVWALLVSVSILLAMHVTILAGTAEITIADALGGDFARAQMVRIVGAVLMLALLYGKSPSVPLLLALGLVDLGAGVAISHAAARVEDRGLLIGITALHHIGAAIWIGGLPCLLSAMRRLPAGEMRSRVGSRYSTLSMISVAAIAFSGIGMLVHYVGSFPALYGTAYGMMLATKTILFFGLLALGYGNFRVVRALAGNPAGSNLRLRRFAEVELGVGITIFFVAASMTSLPPAIDLPRDRVTLTEIAERLVPKWPALSSPSRESLAFYEEQKLLAEEKAEHKPATLQAYVPGSGAPLPRNAHDIAWSEYNHHWAGMIVLIMSILVFLEKTGKAPWARHWPLLLVVLAAFLFMRSEAEAWPIGTLTLAESLRDPEFIQHKAFMILITSFAVFEWSVRNQVMRSGWAKYVFPLLCALGGMMLLTHSHSIANVKELLLIEMTHMPLAVFAIWSGWTRWLELRLDGRAQVIAGWLWPTFFCLTAVTLLLYREI